MQKLVCGTKTEHFQLLWLLCACAELDPASEKQPEWHCCLAMSILTCYIIYVQYNHFLNNFYYFFIYLKPKHYLFEDFLFRN